MRRLRWSLVTLLMTTCLTDTPSVAVPPGTGEHLVLVVADVVPASEADARVRWLNRRFGDLQGFYAEPAVAYELTGAMVQTTADEVFVDCSRDRTVECPPGRSRVNRLGEVALRFVDRARVRDHPFPRSCGRSDRPPCQRDRFAELFGRDMRMPRGKWIIATGFRTRRGAEEFIAFAGAIGVGGLVAVQARKTGGGDIGLGQEAHPDGTGPLTRELGDQARRQRS